MPWSGRSGDFRVVLGAVRRPVPEPGLELKRRHRLLGVVELAGDRRAGPVAGDVAADLGGGDVGLGVQRRGEGVVDLGLGDRVRADGEQQVGLLAGLAVGARGLGWPQCLPRLDRLADDRVDGLGDRGAGLVDGHVEQANGVAGEDVAGVGGDGLPVVLPADATGS